MALAGPAAGQHIDHVEDAERVGEPHDEDHRDHRLQQRQDDEDEELPGRGAVDARRLERIGRQAGEAGEQHQYVEGQRHPQIGDDDRGARQPDVGEPQRSACAERAGDRVDHPVAVDEDEPPGERADDGATISGSATIALNSLLPRKPAMQRQRHREPEDGFEHEACEHDLQRLPERRLELGRAGDPDVVAEPLEVGRRRSSRCSAR